MNPRLTGRVFCIALEPGEISPRPGVNAAIRIDTVIQVHPGIVPMEHVAEAVIGSSLQRLDCLSITCPRSGVIRFRSSPGGGAVGHFREFALALFFAPADPLRVRLECFQSGKLSCVRNVSMWLHLASGLSSRMGSMGATGQALCCSIQACNLSG